MKYPVKMNRPRPPRPIAPATVAVAITWLAAERTPASTSGIAHGASTRISTCHGVSPIPRAASRASASTLSTPAAAFSITGGTASSTSATRIGHSDSGLQRKSKATTANVGIARRIPAVAEAANRPRPLWPIARPVGRPMATAAPVASNEYQRCCTMRRPIPPEPPQFDAVKIHSTPSRKRLTPGSWSTA